MNEEIRSALTAALREASAATEDCPDLFDRVVGAVRRRRRRRLAVAAVGAATAVGVLAAVPSAGVGAPPHSRTSASTAPSDPSASDPSPSDLSTGPAATSGNCAARTAKAPATHVASLSTGAFGAVRHYWGARVEPAIACVSPGDFHAPL